MKKEKNGELFLFIFCYQFWVVEELFSFFGFMTGINIEWLPAMIRIFQNF